MERIPEAKEEGNHKDKEAFEVLDKSLDGKTRSELTAEQKEAEDRFCKENLEEFLSLIEEDKIMTHGAKGSLATTFEHGIASFYQRRDRRIAGLEAGRGDTPWQGENFQFLFKRIIQPYAKSYQEFLAGSLSEEALSNVKAELLEKVPEIGKERVQYFLDNTIPSFLRDGIALPEQKDGMHSTDSTYAPLADSKEISPFKIDKERYSNLTKEEADQALWRRLANIIGGQDMVSSTPASYLKRNFSEKSFLSSGYGHNAYDIYFDTPPQIRMFDLTKIPMAEKDDYDIGVSNRIMPSHFRAFRGGIYDKEKRIFYLIPQIKMEDVKILSERQKEGLLLLDTDLIPLPPIESVQVLRTGISPSPINVFHGDDWDADQKDEIDAMEKISAKNREASEEAIKIIIKEKGYRWGEDAKSGTPPMPKIPTHIKDYVSNADYYLEAEKKLHRREFLAIHIFLLLTAWENIKIAEGELHNWIQKTPIPKALHKSHADKFRDIRKSKSIDRIVLGKPGTKAITISYSTDKEFEKLLKLCRYGTGGGSKELKSIFEKNWFFDDFRNGLITKIGWEKMMISIYESF